MGVRSGATPHAYILNKKLTDADFAADLMRLYRQQAAPVYQDPKVFLQQTYPTSGLQDTLQQVFGRLQQLVGSAAVIRLETAFGGGKTHVMSAVYHLARDGHRLPHVAKALLPESLIPRGPIKTVVLVGDKYSGNRLPLFPCTLSADLVRHFAPEGPGFDTIVIADTMGCMPPGHSPGAA